MAGGGFTGAPPPLGVALVAIAAGAVPALLAQRVPTSQVLAVE